MGWFYGFCALFGLSPLILLGIVSFAFKLYGCDGNMGPAGNKCLHASQSVADALVGMAYLGGFGWLLTIPAALIIAGIGSHAHSKETGPNKQSQR